jgi:hypothetical protein
MAIKEYEAIVKLLIELDNVVADFKGYNRLDIVIVGGKKRVRSNRDTAKVKIFLDI